MPNKNIEMSKLRQILKLYASHKQGTRTIRDLTGVSRTTIMKYIAQFRSSRITWDELSTLSDKDLDDLFNTDIEIPEPPEREKELYAFFPQVDKRMKQPGMTFLSYGKSIRRTLQMDTKALGFTNITGYGRNSRTHLCIWYTKQEIKCL